MGITEYLSKRNKKKNMEVMMIYNNKLSVVPITTHIQLKYVNKNISKSLIEKKIKTLDKSYKKIFNKKPIIGVIGLNPHNFEGRKNSEEIKIIVPVINKLKMQKYKVYGPYPADTIFYNRKRFKLDVIVGMYHDQVLAPFKALFGYEAINVTLGLDYVRVSPDHGTGKDIIGKNKADPNSLIMCIKFMNNLKNDKT